MMKFTFKHWTGAEFSITGELSTKRMGHKGPIMVRDRAEQLSHDLSSSSFEVTIEHIPTEAKAGD